jgi:hypothetical protein
LKRRKWIVSTSVKRLPRAVPADAAKQQEVLRAVTETLETVTLRYYEKMTIDHLWRLKSAIKLLRSKR